MTHALEGTPERLDGLGHLAAREQEDLNHRSVGVRCERSAHALVQVRRVHDTVLHAHSRDLRGTTEAPWTARGEV
jgi:hypothetical protein